MIIEANTKATRISKWVLAKLITNFKFNNETEFWSFMEDFRELLKEYLDRDEDVTIMDEFLDDTATNIKSKVEFV